jgi:catechol 2,3-dioxygenase-like lactoylglutathione lyase family enzyme
MLVDHIDLRVKDVTKARLLYDALMSAMGYTRFDVDGGNINYHDPHAEWSQPFFGLMTDPVHRANGTRVAFRASSRDEVDRLAGVARLNGARDLEGPENYGGTDRYYAAFFEDPDGNKLEICHRE